MPDYAHGFVISDDRCVACLACMRVCPTCAIRVRRGKAVVLSELCIDCGSCLAACPHGAIVATTGSLEDIASRFAFKVAVPSPVLFGQFPGEIHADHVVQGLLAAGFDAVWDYGIELELGARATLDYLDAWDGPRPVINMMCPVILRLIQVSYPRMTEQLVQLQPPREIAGRTIKKWYADQLSVSPDQVAAIYVTACQARTISIIQPAEGGRSYLDGSVGIPQVYNAVLSAARAAARAEPAAERTGPELVRSAAHLRWATPRVFARRMQGRGYLSVTGLAKVIEVFDDIERGRLKGIDFLEGYACWAGCANGNLTVDNVYVSQGKLQALMARLPETDPLTEAEVERRRPSEDFSLEQPFAPRAAVHAGDLRERVRRVKEAERLAAELPGVDCGLCGAPACAVLARDVAGGAATIEECVFVSDARLRELRRLHGSDAADD